MKLLIEVDKYGHKNKTFATSSPHIKDCLKFVSFAQKKSSHFDFLYKNSRRGLVCSVSAY